MTHPSTEDESVLPEELASEPVPGLVVVFSGGAPMLRAVSVGGAVTVLGRDDVGGLALPDSRMSRRHVELRYLRGSWTIRDLDSRNGTFVDGEQVHGTRTLDGEGVLRAGSSLFLLCSDVRGLRGAQVRVEAQRVIGPTLAEALDAVGWSAQDGGGLLITGESGTGKELAARDFHARATPKGPFVPVNCAAIPGTLAERLLFGARKGAYSDAKTDATGYVEAADGGVLFLDEIGELDLQIQAKLLRVLEYGELLPLGASEPKKVKVRLVAATHRDLRAFVADNRFRADLFYRIGRPEVRLPPLRTRREEIPFHVDRVLSRHRSLSAHPQLVETCLLRPWPGNVRELVGELERAARAAIAAGSAVVRPEHLAPHAGAALEPSTPMPGPRGAAPTAEQIRQVLNSSGGNISAAARELGLHRTQLYRLMRKLGIEAETGPE